MQALFPRETRERSGFIRRCHEYAQKLQRIPAYTLHHFSDVLSDLVLLTSHSESMHNLHKSIMSCNTAMPQRVFKSRWGVFGLGWCSWSRCVVLLLSVHCWVTVINKNSVIKVLWCAAFHSKVCSRIVFLAIGRRNRERTSKWVRTAARDFRFHPSVLWCQLGIINYYNSGGKTMLRQWGKGTLTYEKREKAQPDIVWSHNALWAWSTFEKPFSTYVWDLVFQGKQSAVKALFLLC